MTDRPLTEIAPAKINLALHVRGKRDDGRHDLETIFAFCTDGKTTRVVAARDMSDGERKFYDRKYAEFR